MNLELTQDQRLLQEGIEQLVSRHAAIPPGSTDIWLPGSDLERDLLDAGYLDVGRTEGMGAVESALVVEAVARAPYSIEIGATALVVPHVVPDMLLTRPVALLSLPLLGASRFVDARGSALLDCGDVVRVVDLRTCQVEPVDTPFAYPFGKVAQIDVEKARPVDASADVMRQWWRVALAVEIGAVARVALDLTVEYVKQRRQFGRAIGSYQAIQHRLSECAVLVESTQWLARRAAWSGDPADAALAAAYAQQAAARVHYDAHQFHGAMGITNECHLHLWTYRLKALQGELGGPSAQARAAADQLWAA
ncbi:acyl-CoA dehydrogenase family protein [Paraburkholderia pallida]|uniref:Acyl-CoA dehydrogenase n=1 Tax=Paraburkholderia pallida TaxID=2547399 RepID=A0A4P7CUW5_9BURK|nr:acyl-CoA dehydrogenase family protein [Paraburkholderia pallida]QBQ99077.1 acyl-CoA dehydrogenase [Paraburkholderia pallida]